MLNKLALRNVKRSVRDYLVYLLTMTLITALMFAFNTMLFSPDVQKIGETAMVMTILIGMATFFIVMIVAWLINYMVRFMMEKRSREFGIYLLMGMKRKQLARLYMRENIVLGLIAFGMGIGLGIVLQQFLMNVFYRIFGVHYRLRIFMNPWCLLLTGACFSGCFLLALLRNKRKFRKMNINYLINLERRNDEIKEKGVRIKQWLFFIAIGYIIFFQFCVFHLGQIGMGITLLILLLFTAVYLFFIGLAAFLVCFIRKGHALVFQNVNLFLFRQLAAKIRTMQFTMGTLSVLFAFALMGGTAAMMLGDYQNKELAGDFPFDVLIHDDQAGYQFERELEIIREHGEIKEQFRYPVYRNEANDRNVYLYTHLYQFGDTYRTPEGNPDMEAIRTNMTERYNYGPYDPYMCVSDYNQLRAMLGLEQVQLDEGRYLIHLADRVMNELERYDEAEAFAEGIETKVNGSPLKFAGYHTEDFSQDGHNGADYLVIVPDSAADFMTEYYSQLAVSGFPAGRQDNRQTVFDAGLLEQLQAERSRLRGGEDDYLLVNGSGSKQIIVYTDAVLVKDEQLPEAKFIITAISFPLLYIGLVFLCVALTILSVQQLSDSAKYKFRYAVLHKLGMRKKEIDKVIFKQLFLYYLTPVLAAVAISVVISLFISERFIFYTGVETNVFAYFGLSLLVFVGVYLVYFTITYISYRRNVNA